MEKILTFCFAFYCPKSTENRTTVIVKHVSCCVSVVIAMKTKVYQYSFALKSPSTGTVHCSSLKN